MVPASGIGISSQSAPASRAFFSAFAELTDEANGSPRRRRERPSADGRLPVPKEYGDLVSVWFHFASIQTPVASSHLSPHVWSSMGLEHQDSTGARTTARSGESERRDGFSAPLFAPCTSTRA